MPIRAYFARWMEAHEAGALVGCVLSTRTAPGCSRRRDGRGRRPRAPPCWPPAGLQLKRHFGAGSVTLARREGEWHAVDSAGRSIAQAPVVVVANGAGAATLAQTAALPLASVRGQVTYLAEGALPKLDHVLCREAYLIPAIDGWHSLGASYDDDADPALRMESQHENLEKIRSLLGDPGIAPDAPLAGRVGFRCVAPDRLPLVGALPDPHALGRTERLREIRAAAGPVWTARLRVARSVVGAAGGRIARFATR
ncbi:hypothetical protein LP420_15770 [Massilia sp. B-10]|nr:hypothetical protein LP420_15770 [Massilia sp. B-10]